ncbi:MAG: carboxypeptidase-like regulatory domain-containing protein [Deltaproteobacteria bacterium]|nr:carboxypeptidase-like regulatory domain-containing protein [Deltaproteobacteria bacterium]
MKKHLLGLLACAVLLLFFAASVSAGWWHTGWGRHYRSTAHDMHRVHPWARLFRSGDIIGTVVCSEDNTIPAEGAQVFIPGASFVAITDADGTFRIYNVPRGTYDIAVEFTEGVGSGQTGVKVFPRRVTRLAEPLVVKCETENEVGNDVPQPPVLESIVKLADDGSATRSFFGSEDKYQLTVRAEAGSVVHLFTSGDCADGTDYTQITMPQGSSNVTLTFQVSLASFFSEISLTAENEVGMSECAGPYQLSEALLTE